MFARTLTEGLEALGQRQYEALIIDLGIPAPTTPLKAKDVNPVFVVYPGLHLAYLARNEGYGPERVFIYSVHDSEDVDREIQKLSSTYLLKGRPREAKEAFRSLLARPRPKRAQ